MPTIQEMCSESRLLADEPRPSKPSLRRVLLAVLQATQTFYARLGNTGEAWSLKPDYQLQVTPNTGDYPLAIDPSYGKPLQVLTYYPQNQSVPQRYIDFRQFASMQFDWGWPVNAASWMWTDGSPNTAMRMAFYYKDDGTPWVRVLPMPMLSASYLITFESGDYTSTVGMEQSPILTQFHALIEAWAALSFLPSCEWYDDPKENREHRRELAASLKNDENRIADEFDRHVRSLVIDQMGTRVSSFDNDGNYGGW